MASTRDASAGGRAAGANDAAAEEEPAFVSEEEKNLRNLFRVGGGFIAWPALSISLVFMLDLDEHLLHIAGLLPIGLAGVAMFVMAPKLAKRFSPQD